MHLAEIPDTSNLRYVYFSDGGYAKLVREDPYGFWYVRWHVGTTPQCLQSSYTEVDKARSAVERYINSNEYNGYANIVPEKVKMAPPLETKKRFKREESTNLGT